MKNGIVTFAGAGPGAVDLMTIRCRNAIEEADVIVYAGSLVNPDTLQFAAPDCALFDSAGMNLEETTSVLVEAALAGRKALRLHTGDPALYGAIAEQMRRLDEARVEYEIIPGVTAMFAAAASVKAELTLPGISQSIIIGRRAGRTPVPPGQEIPALAKPQATMALYLSVADMDGLIHELYEGGYTENTAVAVVYRATWPDEQIIQGTLGDIAKKVTEAGIGRQAVILVGDALKGMGEESLLYDASFSHGYRSANPEKREQVSPLPARQRFSGNVAIYALTEAGCSLATQLNKSMQGSLFLSKRFGKTSDGTLFDPTTFGSLIKENWNRFDGHIFIMATGIVLRKIAPLLKGKTEDPAVVTCDEKGAYAISLLSGHIGGANRLAQETASLLGGRAVITTATDVQGVTAFDDLAMRYHWDIVNPEMIKELNSLLLQNKPIGILLPSRVKKETYKNREKIVLLDSAEHISEELQGLVVLDLAEVTTPLPVLYLKRKSLAVGIGCNRGSSAEEIADALHSVLENHELSEQQIKGLASIDIKNDEKGLLAYAERNHFPITFFTSEELKQIKVKQPSDLVLKETGTPSVSEAASRLLGKGKLLVPKQICGGVTVAVTHFTGDV